MPETAHLLDRIAEAIARAVAETPREQLGQPGGMGASGSPSKHIDRVAERAAMDVLEDTGAELNLCSEEVGTVDRGAERTLVLDPVDGTTNCVRGVPFYCTSLAVTREGLGDVEMGLVVNLPTGDRYFARRGHGATLNGEPLSTRTFNPEQALCTPVYRPDRLPSVDDRVAATKYKRDMGAAALELCLVAQGAMDVFLHLTTGLRIVDVAAGILIVEEAGGVAVRPDGARPQLPLEVSERTHLVAVGDRTVLDHLGIQPQGVAG